MTGSFGTLQKSLVSISDASTNKALQITEDPLCLQPLLNGEHERLTPIHILPANELTDAFGKPFEAVIDAVISLDMNDARFIVMDEDPDDGISL
nr:hypothetical protein [Tanacetum cinerariifolium]